MTFLAEVKDLLSRADELEEDKSYGLVAKES